MIKLTFSGWFECRIATDPDPTDEPRGVSGWTAAVAGEPVRPSLVQSEQPVQAALPQECQVGEAAERPVSQEQIALLHGVVHRRRGGEVVGAERGEVRLDEVAGLVVEEGQQVRHGEAAAGLLVAGLAEFGLEFGRVGHRDAAAVEQPDAGAVSSTAGNTPCPGPPRPAPADPLSPDAPAFS